MFTYCPIAAAHARGLTRTSVTVAVHRLLARRTRLDDNATILR